MGSFTHPKKEQIFQFIFHFLYFEKYLLPFLGIIILIFKFSTNWCNYLYFRVTCVNAGSFLLPENEIIVDIKCIAIIVSVIF